MDYKLLCTDIDGTLLNKDRELSEKTIFQFKRIKDRCSIVLASSRMPEAMRHLQREVDILNNPMIAYNGGLVLDGESIISTTEISLEVLERIVELSKGTEVHISIYNNDDWYVPSMDYWATREMNNTKVTPTVSALPDTLNILKKENKGAHKVMCMGPAEEIAQMYDNLIASYGNDLHVYRSKDTYLEIANKSISKKSAIQSLLKHKYPSLDWKQIIAYGDNYNDMEMLEAVGMGVAVSNAKEEVLSLADDITASNKEDGVALSVAKYFL
ncbi:MAG: haloacid dehalogenase [Bacteroidetes bacterium]|nr:MAG: haloacid dehalogenase [Bacteroidota bacterium]